MRTRGGNIPDKEAALCILLDLCRRSPTSRSRLTRSLEQRLRAAGWTSAGIVNGIVEPVQEQAAEPLPRPAHKRLAPQVEKRIRRRIGKMKGK